MHSDPLEMLGDRPPRTVMDDIETNTRLIDEQAGGIRFELEALSAQLERRLTDIHSMIELEYGHLSRANATLNTIKLVLLYLAAVLTVIALR